MPKPRAPARIRALLLAALAIGVATPARAQPAPTPVVPLGTTAMIPGMMGTSESALFAKLLPTVVNIVIRKDVTRQTSNTLASGAEKSTTRAFGSGFVIDPSGIIATNFHVVDDAWQIDVGFHDGTHAAGHLLRATRLLDVALVKVDVGHPLPVVTWGDSNALAVGDPLFAIGNALGVGISVSGGLVSALNRDIMDSPYDDFIQTDAAINHGNSGGPLFNMRGEVVGINTALISPTSGSSGLGFAIPARTAQNIINRLDQYGWLRPGWIGVKIQGVTPDMALALGMAQPDGSIVANVTPDSPAEKVGLRVGDVVTRVDDERPTDERALLRAIVTTPIGKTVTLGLWRDGRQQSLDIPVEEWPRAQWETFDPPVAMIVAHHHIAADLGLSLARPEDGTHGAMVTDVAAGDAAQRGIATGDVILRVQEKTVDLPADATTAFAAARAAGRRFVLVLVAPKTHQTPGPQWIALQVADD